VHDFPENAHVNDACDHAALTAIHGLPGLGVEPASFDLTTTAALVACGCAMFAGPPSRMLSYLGTVANFVRSLRPALTGEPLRRARVDAAVEHGLVFFVREANPSSRLGWREENPVEADVWNGGAMRHMSVCIQSCWSTMSLTFSLRGA
jgi:hypothetical protein